MNVFVQRDQATVSVDLSGDSLHRRGYREPGEQVAAPLKETLAAAILLRAGWPRIAAAGGSVVDPLCGSGTLPIEAALIACDVAPGALREHWGFLGWKGHDAAAWSALRRARRARAARRRSPASRAAGALPLAFGYDNDRRAIALARDNVRRAGLDGIVHVERRELSELAPPPLHAAAPESPDAVADLPPAWSSPTRRTASGSAPVRRRAAGRGATPARRRRGNASHSHRTPSSPPSTSCSASACAPASAAGRRRSSSPTSSWASVSACARSAPTGS